MNQNRFLFLTFSFSIVMLANIAMAKVLPIETFIKHGDYLEMQISPDGKHLAGRIRSDGRISLIFINLENGKIVGGARGRNGNDIHTVTWVSNKRVVYEIAVKQSGFDRKRATGELFAINIDGSNSQHLYGYRASDKKVTSRISNKKNNYSSLEVLNVLENDKKNILIIEYPWEQEGNYWYDRRSRSAIISKLNINSGRRKKIEVIPYNNVTALADDNGNVNFIRWESKDNKLHAAYRKKNKDKWQELSSSFNLGKDMLPVSISKDSSKVYMSGKIGDAGLHTIFELDLATGKKTQLFNNIEADLYNFIYDADSLKPVVGITYPDKANYHYAPGESSTSKTHQKLAKAFKGQDILFTSRTKDGKLILVRAESDVNPGGYYLYNTETKKADFVWANKSWVDPRLMRPVKSIELTARDGLKMKGYLTLPESDNNKKAPLVVLVHGGPHGIRDYWEYNDEVQLLANRGYAVLQVNFRGSGGYGEAFEDKGERQWGGDMINDILDATHHVFKNEPIDANRACIYGASYGGYASLMAAVREPNTFKCTVGYVGIYDLELMYTDGDIPDNWGGQAYLERVIGRDEQQLKEFSPINHVDKINAAVMLIHGEEDHRAPVIHAKKMRKKLKKAGKNVEWLLYGNSGHGVWSMKNRKDLYSNLLKFLDKHIGENATVTKN